MAAIPAVHPLSSESLPRAMSVSRQVPLRSVPYQFPHLLLADSLTDFDPFAGSDDQQVSPLSHGIVVQPSAASLVRTCLGGIASASNHALDILD